MSFILPKTKILFFFRTGCAQSRTFMEKADTTRIPHRFAPIYQKNNVMTMVMGLERNRVEFQIYWNRKRWVGRPEGPPSKISCLSR
jgi:hypothetical protein